jgi:hypothetical protein
MKPRRDSAGSPIMRSSKVSNVIQKASLLPNPRDSG